MRLALAVLAGAAVAALGALILGEYEFTGTTPYVAGVLFGLVVAEAMVTVARRGGRGLAVAAAALAGGGLLWAAWISSGRDWDYVFGPAYVAVALGVVSAGWRTATARSHATSRIGVDDDDGGVRSSEPPAADSPPGP